MYYLSLATKKGQCRKKKLIKQVVGRSCSVWELERKHRCADEDSCTLWNAHGEFLNTRTLCPFVQALLLNSTSVPKY